MHFYKKIFFFICLILFSSHAIAGKDPIGWQLNGSFPNPITAGSNYSITYTFTNNLPLQLINPLVIEKTASPANEFNYIDNCSGVLLTSQQTCIVQILMAPVTSGQKSVQLIIAGYSSDRVPLPILTTQTPGSGSSQILGTVSQSLPGSLDVGTSANFLFTFTNQGTVAVSDVSVEASVSPTSTTCGSSLAAGALCTVSGTYTPTAISPSAQTVSATLNSSGGSATASTTTNVPPATGVVISFVSPNYLPAEMINGTQSIQMLYTNYGPGAVTVTSNPATMVAITTGASSATYTENNSESGNNSCTTNTVLNPGSACQSLGTFTASASTFPTAIAVTGTITYSGGTGGPSVSKTTSTTVVSALSSTRTVQFVNNCDFPVWFSTNGGAIANSPSCSCTTAPCQSNCPTGSTCNGTLCYWNNPTPTDNNYELTTGHLSDTVTIPANNIGGTQWSGNFAASLGCDGSSKCTQADCENAGGSAQCAVGTGYTQPATQAEITMLANDADSYDVEVINGMSVPTSFAPGAPGSFVNVSDYTCGTPGGAVATNGFGACNWTGTATPPSFAYYLVSGITSTAPSCLAGNTCSISGQICGLDATLDPVCGDFLGYWSSDQACGINASKANAYFDCNNAVANPPGSVLSQFMLCVVPKNYSGPNYNSCYSTYPVGTDTSTCCGCVDWWTIGIGANATAQSCNGQTNPTWTTGGGGNPSIQSQIQWMKKACPSIYTYPFDDATSKFTCSNTLPGVANSVNYTVTFCPGTSTPGDTGLPPSGVTEGRGPFI